MMELEHFEAARNDNFNHFPFCYIHRRDRSDIFSRVSPLGNSLLHVAASSGAVAVTELMVHHFPSLITLKNYQGDTALHVAARAGKLHTAEVLVNKEPKSPNRPFESLLVMTNNRGNTALHESLLALQAVRNSMGGTACIQDKEELKKREDLEDDIVSVACFLVQSADPEVCYRRNKEDKSPLCLAVMCGDKVVLDHILQAIREPGEDDDDGKAIGNCLMHLMIANQPCLFDVLKLIKEVKPKLLLLRDEKGNTLLHGAAFIGYMEGVLDLLKIKRDIALERNHEGFYAIHFACENGHVDVMKELLKSWPHPTELLNHKGQNILHVAAKKGNEYMVRRISQLQDSDILVKMMDDDGNTPLHLAAKHSKPMVLGTLILFYRSKGLQMHLRNNRSQTAYDIAVSAVYQCQMIDEKKNKIDQVESSEARSQGEVQKQQHDHVKNFDGSTEVDYSLTPDFVKLTTLSILYFCRPLNLPGGYLSSLKVYLRAITDLVDLQKPANGQEVNQKMNSFLVVATLIVGLAFAASIQVDSSNSGSVNDDNSLSHSQRTTHAENSALQFFTIYDTLALNTALIGASMMCWSQFIDAHLASLMAICAYAFVAYGLWMTSVAFIFSKFLRIQSYLTSTLIVVMAIMISGFIFQALFALLCSPLKEAFVLSVYLFLFCVYYAYWFCCAGYYYAFGPPPSPKDHFKHINASSH